MPFFCPCLRTQDTTDNVGLNNISKSPVASVNEQICSNLSSRVESATHARTSINPLERSHTAHCIAQVPECCVCPSLHYAACWGLHFIDRTPTTVTSASSKQGLPRQICRSPNFQLPSNSKLKEVGWNIDFLPRTIHHEWLDPMASSPARVALAAEIFDLLA